MRALIKMMKEEISFLANTNMMMDQGGTFGGSSPLHSGLLLSARGNSHELVEKQWNKLTKSAVILQLVIRNVLLTLSVNVN